ncbi:2-oxo-4-hydroxy-4-carboxy-5-ureidoimidazoline decarboxylase [Aestuariivirga litoralis]|uniref:2-oxo-4-hydroxy-4-carboxy-5-ureidoimidazoline decarboxylase n=1 Tax=Aestuariivirga litoralis TaxID=2650924 RepID=UPI0018C6E696|nr:2-oxo-4-hydroxy-4-carboxy-5-ureidoimidazoline decarboxylase [Aestuariivirga litoralis]MBG1232624.1 2-oxo-4-hydroxy-4-carboxy-5-ureidoimidazoline decarboxylase [Aestuariivirga litoralis]
MKLNEVNTLDAAGFERVFGDIAEHSPWVAQEAFAAAPFASRDAMIKAFRRAMRDASDAAKITLLRAHPDLATRAKLTEDSTNEQKGAGLDTLTAEEFARFTELNDSYKEKNGFPFIFAVRGATKNQILSGFEERIHNDTDAEFETALEQVGRIIRFRLEDRIEE